MEDSLEVLLVGFTCNLVEKSPSNPVKLKAGAWCCANVTFFNLLN